jgi:hypothetical protein
MENPFFLMANQKTLVTKVAGNGKMHITAKNGVNIQKLYNLHKPSSIG